MKKDHITTRLIICALVLVFGIVGIAASGDITYRKIANALDDYQWDVITVPALKAIVNDFISSGKIKGTTEDLLRNLYEYTTAVVIDGEEISPAELTYYYEQEYRNYMNDDSKTASKEDLQKITGLIQLADIKCEQNMTNWRKYFLDKAVETIKENIALINYARSKGIVLSAEQTQEARNTVSVSDFNSFGLTLSLMEKIATDQKLVTIAKEHLSQEYGGAKSFALQMAFWVTDMTIEYTPFLKITGFSEKDVHTPYGIGRIVPKDLHPGDTIQLGFYEQDNKIRPGREPIEWIILDVRDEKALLISKYALDCQPYNTVKENTQWEKSTIRQWLNSTFWNYAFTEEEQNAILVTEVKAVKNPQHDTNPGNNTEDRIFLLDISGAEKYLSTDTDRICFVTEYGKAQGISSGKSGHCKWWLRSQGRGSSKHPDQLTITAQDIAGTKDGDILLNPGLFADAEQNAMGSSYAAIVEKNGAIDYYGYAIDNEYTAIRPAMWVSTDLSDTTN